MPLPVTLLLGPSAHGVVRYARELSAAGGLPVGDDGERMHVHVTDRALAATPADAAARIEALAERAPLTVTLHDVPQESDGERNLRRRGDAYRRIAAAARGVAVSSEHEKALVAEHLGIDTVVIPLGVRRSRAPESEPPRPRADVLLAGFVYPGKGHEDAIVAASVLSARLGEIVTVRALGGVSDGHADEAERLGRLAESLGVGFVVTGFLDDAEYTTRLRGDGIPLIAHRHISASRSLLDWIDEGRRPLVIASPYVEETARLRPGTVTPYRSLPDALEAAWREPASTVLPTGAPLGPTLADSAAQYRRWWNEAVAW
ncbi:hypothetical protein HQQ80_16700 [Microbacteriaceae bacterium VKM Ac-2855]|nr:hypothetical protein [Microbacteriaceae bacterium VKM Ac-2855]